MAGRRGSADQTPKGAVAPPGNLDPATVRHFGREWTDFDQSGAEYTELERIFSSYFAVFPWERLPREPVGMDFGCGSGRWAAFVAPRVGFLHCVDASDAALAVARRNLAHITNWRACQCTAETLPFADDSLDFAYSLGVLHHVPDTAAALRACVRKLRPGAPFLLYLYYRFDNRPRWFRLLWRTTDVLRRAISAAPHRVKLGVTGMIAASVYWPLARLSAALARRGIGVSSIPLSFYRDASFYTMRTDALDRFGTPLERRFTATEIRALMESAGLTGITFSDSPPFWCAVGFRSTGEP